MSIPSIETKLLILMAIRCIKIVGGSLKIVLKMLEVWAKKGELPNDLT